MEEFRTHRARVWRHLQAYDLSLGHTKYNLKDVFLKLRFHKYDVTSSGTLKLHPEVVEKAGEPAPDLSDPK